MILTSILFCLSLHSLSIYISFLFPSFQQILSELYGTRVVFQRYAGLTSGYDISGFFAIFGCYISYLFYKKNNNTKNNTLKNKNKLDRCFEISKYDIKYKRTSPVNKAFEIKINKI